MGLIEVTLKHVWKNVLDWTSDTKNILLSHFIITTREKEKKVNATMDERKRENKEIIDARTH